mgnify:CR=1 FL=1
MSIEKSKELQERIVITIFENAPENWDKYCQYLELIPLDDDFDNSLLSVWFNGSEEMDYKINASNEYALYKLFAELNNVMKQTNKRWTTCKMQVTSDGRYNFNFGYDKPPGLMGSAENFFNYHEPFLKSV